MTVFTDNDEKVLKDYLLAYKECFEAMNDLACAISSRVELTDEETELARTADMKYKNMVYHIRKWTPTFNKINKKQ